MTKITVDKALIEQAIDAFELHAKQYPHMVKGYTLDAATALRAALEQTAPQTQEKSNDHKLVPLRPPESILAVVRKAYGNATAYDVGHVWHEIYTRLPDAAPVQEPEGGKRFHAKFNVGDRVWYMKDNKPTEVVISAIEIFFVNTNQDRITYDAKNVTNSVSWLDNTKLQEACLFKSKAELLESL